MAMEYKRFGGQCCLNFHFKGRDNLETRRRWEDNIKMDPKEIGYECVE
jgi:hypothetical protein